MTPTAPADPAPAFSPPAEQPFRRRPGVDSESRALDQLRIERDQRAPVPVGDGRVERVGGAQPQGGREVTGMGRRRSVDRMAAALLREARWNATITMGQIVSGEIPGGELVAMAEATFGDLVEAVVDTIRCLEDCRCAA